MSNLKVQPTYELLEVSKLKISSYQRPPETLRVQAIVNEFNQSKLGVIMISYRDGSYYVVDGQHRVMACRALNKDFIMCEVHRGLTYEQEAELFYTQGDKRKGISAIDKFHGKTEAKKEDSLTLKNIIESHGFKIAKGKSKYTIAAIGTIEKIHRIYGLDVLNKTLYLISQTWNGIIESTDAQLLLGVAMFLKSNEIQDKEFIKLLGRVEPKVILREGESDISNEGFTRFKIVIEKYYNKGRRKK